MRTLGVWSKKIQEGGRYNLQKSPGGSDQRKVGRDKGEGRGQGKNGPGDVTVDYILCTTLHS